MVASLFAWRAGCIERRSNAAPTSAFTLYEFPTMAKRHSLGYVGLKAWIAAAPAQGARTATFHIRIESVPACLPVEGRAVACIVPGFIQ